MPKFSEFEDGAICSGNKPEKLVIDVKEQKTVYNYPDSSRATDCIYEFELEDIHNFDDVLSAVAQAVTI